MVRPIIKYYIVTGNREDIHREVNECIKEWRQPYWPVLSTETEHSKMSYYTQAMVKYEDEDEEKE